MEKERDDLKMKVNQLHEELLKSHATVEAHVVSASSLHETIDDWQTTVTNKVRDSECPRGRLLTNEKTIETLHKQLSDCQEELECSKIGLEVPG
jgi:alpha-L-arabinofuranosidase